MAIKTITHGQISATTAGKLGEGVTSESVSKTVKTYSDCVLGLMKDNLPETEKDLTFIETPIAGYQISAKTNGIVKSVDGKDVKIGKNYVLQTCVPNEYALGINEEVIKGLGKIGEALINLFIGKAS